MARLNAPVFLYGPPASGKSTLGTRLAQSLDCAFIDLDQVIQQRLGQSISEFFAASGEAEFRARETQALEALDFPKPAIVALGGGTLLHPDNRAWAEARGPILVLGAPLAELQRRLSGKPGSRPLAPTAAELDRLLSVRSEHYASFSMHMENHGLSLESAVWQAQKLLGRFCLQAPGQHGQVEFQTGLLNDIQPLGEFISPSSPLALITDETVGTLYASQVVSELQALASDVHLVTLPAGESAKSASNLLHLWHEFATAQLERTSTVIALGGGVIHDLAGFASATYLRGLQWIGIPTTLLAMVDAALGGKTAIDLPQGKNLAGAFHLPRLTWIDPTFLDSLPESELSNGLAELLKSAILGDCALFERCMDGRAALAQDWMSAIIAAAAVKIDIVNQDPHEMGPRAALNFGHTIGHALERLSQYQVPHGQAVAVGMHAEACLGELAGITPAAVRHQIHAGLVALNLPTTLPRQYSPEDWLAAMQSDKKNRAAKIGFALPVALGDIKAGYFLDDLPVLVTDLLR